jgi:hypothetical protein
VSRHGSPVGHFAVRDGCFFFYHSVVVVGEWPDAFRSARGKPVVERFLKKARRTIPSGSTLAAIPEGVMLNYLLRLRNPTPYVNLMPPEMRMFGEGRILAAYREHPPDFIALVHKNTSEFGYRFFGRDYGVEMGRWIDDQYEPVSLAGKLPFHDENFGILLVRRKGWTVQ